MPDKMYHLLTREDGSTVLYYTLGDDPAHYIIYDTLDNIKQQVRDLAAKVGKHPDAQALRQMFNEVYIEARLGRVEDKLRGAKRLEDCPKLSEI